MKKVTKTINFKNGAKFTATLLKRVPFKAKEANDYIKLTIKPGKDRGEIWSGYMNIYDCYNLVWLLSNSVLESIERGNKEI